MGIGLGMGIGSVGIQRFQPYHLANCVAWYDFGDQDMLWDK